MQPAWDSLKESDSEAIFEEINIDDNPQLRADYFVRSIPTIVAVKDGKEVGRVLGTKSLTELKSFINECREV